MTRIVILTEGHTEPHSGKTAASILRYRGDEVLGLVDSTQAGRTAGELLGVGGDKPIRADLADFDAEELVIGVAPAGLDFPASWRKIIIEAIARGMNVTNGTHTLLNEDDEFKAAARAKNVTLRDLRTPPPHIGTSKDRAGETKPVRVHSVGLDCSVGKMTATIELDRALRARGLNSRFLATGQSGILVSGYGLPIDRFISDFVAGAAETLVLENLDRDYLLIEGQGSLFHPLFSGVTLGLLHGCAPDFLILCYDPMRTKLIETKRSMPSLEEAIVLYTTASNLIHPCRIVGIAANTQNMSEQEAREELKRAERVTGLPSTDVIRFGCEKLLDAIIDTPRPSAASPPALSGVPGD